MALCTYFVVGFDVARCTNIGGEGRCRDGLFFQFGSWIVSGLLFQLWRDSM